MKMYNNLWIYFKVLQYFAPTVFTFWNSKNVPQVTGMVHFHSWVEVSWEFKSSSRFNVPSILWSFDAFRNGLDSSERKRLIMPKRCQTVSQFTCVPIICHTYLYNRVSFLLSGKDKQSKKKKREGSGASYSVETGSLKCNMAVPGMMWGGKGGVLKVQ